MLGICDIVAKPGADVEAEEWEDVQEKVEVAVEAKEDEKMAVGELVSV